jgi:hypothetical protein
MISVLLVLPSDILTPAVGLVFLWLSYKHPKSEAALEAGTELHEA